MMLPVLRPFQKIPKRKQAESKPGQAEGQVLVRRSTSGQGLQVGARDADRADSRERPAPEFHCGGPARATATRTDVSSEIGIPSIDSPSWAFSSLNLLGSKGPTLNLHTN